MAEVIEQNLDDATQGPGSTSLDGALQIDPTAQPNGLAPKPQREPVAQPQPQPQPDPTPQTTPPVTPQPTPPPLNVSQAPPKEVQAPEVTGVEKMVMMKNAGFTDQEISDWKDDAQSTMLNNGFSAQEVKDYFGIKDPDTSALKAFAQGNVANKAPENKPGAAQIPNRSFYDQLKDALGGLEHDVSSGALTGGFEQGFSASTLGMKARGAAPENVPVDASRAFRIASMVGQFTGDLPAMLAGGAIGSIGGPIGASAGAFAAPAALRKIMMDHYQKGDIISAGEFADRAVAAGWEASKGAATGAATGFLGPVAGAVGGTAAKFATELVTMTSVSKMLEGQMPNADDFINGAILIGGLHVAGAVLPEGKPLPGPAEDLNNAQMKVAGAAQNVAAKLRSIYASTGTHPSDVVDAVKADPVLATQMLSDNPNLPSEANFKPNPEAPVFNENGEKTNPDFTQALEAKKIDPNDPRVMPYPQVEGDGTPPQDKLSVPPPSPFTANEGIGAQVKRLFVDKLNPIKMAVKQLTDGVKLPAGEDPYVQSILHSDYAGKIKSALSYGTLDFETGSKNGEGLTEILKDAPKVGANEELTPAENKVLEQVSPEALEGKNNTWKRLTAYLLANRHLELSERGVETGIDPEAANTVVQDNEETHGPIAERLTDYQNRMAAYARDSGLLSKNSYNRMTEANKNFIPFYRLQDTDPFTGEPIRNSGQGKGFAGIQGSDRLIDDPIESVIKNTAAIIRKAELNRVTSTLIDLNNSKPMDEQLLRPAESKLRPIDVQQKEVARFLTSQGVEDDSIPGEGFTIFRPVDGTLKQNEIQVYKDGKRQVYQTYDQIAQAVKALSPSPGLMDVWAKGFLNVLKAPGQGLRIGTVLNPEFMGRHFFRSQTVAGIFSNYNQIPFLDALIGVGHMIGNSEEYQEYVSSGGGNSSFMKVSKLLDSNPWELSKESGGWLSKVQNTIKSPLELAQVVSELSDNAARFAEYRKGGGTNPDADYNTRSAAAFSAKNISLNYNRSGVAIDAIKAFVPFLNVGIQGTARTIEAFQDNPVRTFAKATAMITAPSIALWYANKDDSRYINAPDWEKDLFWIIPTDKWQPANGALDAASREPDQRRQLPDGSWEVNNGHVYRLPKPFEIGVLFGSLPERAADAFYRKNPDAFDTFGKTLANGIVPNVLPPIVTAPMEQAANYNSFTGRPIVNSHSEKFGPSLQYNEYTSETAKLIGKAIGWVGGDHIGPEGRRLSSPAVVENYVRDWTGTLGGYVLQLSDAALRTAGVTPDIKPVSKLEDSPFIKGFMVRNPGTNAQNIVNFKNEYKKAAQDANDLKALSQRGFQYSAAAATLQQQGDPRFAAIKAEADRSLDAASKISAAVQYEPKLSGAYETINNLNKVIQETMANPSYSKSDKGQLIDNLYGMMSQTATQANETLKQYKAALKGTK